MTTRADDLAVPMDALDVRTDVLAGRSTGGGDVARSAGRHGTARVAKAVPAAAGAAGHGLERRMA
ncbi:hypothetical protein [Poseidonocella sp. HB161398]|uniref:hypothetical protein n=1 Tax=Poseidonocella sp. HB161398 TaxID=2320855 RepID=UPI001108A77E|nr:hypothetical protein [Poseidonocella sp. HB161398]